MDIGKAFTYMFDDDQWITKILIAAAITLIGVAFGILVIPAILAFALLGGYGVEITRRVIDKRSPVLPEWDDWGTLLLDGLKVWVIGIVYALPVIILGLCLSPLTAVAGDSSQGLASLFSSVLGCLNFLWGIVMGLLIPAAIAFFVVEGQISAAFRFGDVFAFVRDNFATYLVVLVIAWVAGLIGGLGFLVCGVGWLVTIPYASWVTGHLYGQAYLEAKGSAPQPVLEEEAA
jgi:hypothetical protein